MDHCRKEEGLDADQAYENLQGPFHNWCGIYTWGSMKYVHVLGSLCASSAITYISCFLYYTGKPLDDPSHVDYVPTVFV